VPEVEETGETFEANARLKGTALCTATGLPAVADDSGLEVDALGGAPGVRSARYAGPAATSGDNLARLLEELDGVDDRRARFRTVALVAFPDGTELVAEGRCEGRIAEGARGGGGFGYDPVFLAEGADGRTFGELSSVDKHALSARGRAFRALAEGLAALLEGR
jgi:XTP/dITP diphosphohydrolase